MFRKSFDLKFFASQLGIMLKSGLNLNRSLIIISKQTKNQEEKEVYSGIIRNIESGLSLAEALKEEKVFTDLFTAVVRAGEESGTLVEVLKSLENYYSNKEDLKKEIKKASFYPLTVITTVFLAAAFIFKFILPVFIDLFAEFSGKLPLITRIFLKLSLIFNDHFILIVIFIILLIILLFLVFKNNKRNDLKSKFLLKIPLFSVIYQDLILTQIATYLSLFLKSGLKLISALELLKNIVSDHQYQNFIKKTALNISKGASLTECFDDSEYIPNLFYYLIMTGEETARMETMLERAGDYYSKKLKNEIAKMLQYLEPFLITLTAIFVALLAAAVMMPMFQIYLII
ncbi:type IV pilus assembly protein PilC/MSHA biogenesis protein MshG [Halanaerobium saccharolyticum]|uniref:Type IV pilus assembly protein PilC/MSHA biogenesis protein MshG n=1 Tax=Halanaerobium saccharolyticum TaxID=43595 RepID=A0A4V3G5V1_9FIRM|nr:type IV pilus assembly protein PilC/MSHA biogenesis protein MshG [Halanaerobium saccharolyticum]TDW06888.1 type IV pilus assembly protein PilC/MSHA biogenesis protein MshG [Halanaerobium saccharolyticum]TDX63653.1 type IV pilus assembly protein PilC/MSHA biogenesis protein MshG [Halanaerobium saccharolyticum]